jgi:hypothetical protein
MYEIERTVVYVSFAFALAILGRRSMALLMPALLAAIVAVATYGPIRGSSRIGSSQLFVGYRL